MDIATDFYRCPLAWSSKIKKIINNTLRSSASKILAVGSLSGLQFFDVRRERPTELADAKLEIDVIAVAWLGDQLWLSDGSRVLAFLVLWDNDCLVINELKRRKIPNISCMNANPQTQVMSCGTRTGHLLDITDLAAKKFSRVPIAREPICALSWSPDGRCLAVGTDSNFYTVHEKEEKKIKCCFPFYSGVRAIAWKTSTIVVAGGGTNNASMKLIDVTTKKIVRSIATQRQVCFFLLLFQILFCRLLGWVCRRMGATSSRRMVGPTKRWKPKRSRLCKVKRNWVAVLNVPC